jgi:hypothetical protein
VFKEKNMSDTDLFAGVDKNTKVDHIAIHVAFGMLIAATTLFKKLGYKVHPTRKAEGAWGKAIFMVKKGSIPIQLTDSSKDLNSEVWVGDNHVAIVVNDPLVMAKQIQLWAFRGNQEANYEDVSGGKYFVYLPTILTMPIELVPAIFKPCPECGGSGEVIRGSEGRGFHYACPTCCGK